MTQRLQLNLRMDNQEELLEAVKARAKEERVTVKEFVIAALKNALQQPSTSQPSQPNNNELHTLKERINGVQIGLMGEMRKRDERIDKLEQLIGVVAEAIALLTSENFGDAPDSQPPIDRVNYFPDTGYQTWEERALSFLEGATW